METHTNLDRLGATTQNLHTALEEVRIQKILRMQHSISILAINNKNIIYQSNKGRQECQNQSRIWKAVYWGL